MIKLRLSVNGEQTEFAIVSGETLSSAIDRALDKVPLGEFKKEEVFQALLNGKHIPHEMWGMVKLQENDTVLIAPILKGDDPTSVFKQFVMIAVTAVASFYLGPAGAGLTGVGLGLATAGVTMAAGLLLNALIPPPVPETGALDTGGDLATSQMYSISGQSNQVKRFGVVPKVYGTHRMFPLIAANPYTELETDPSTGKLVQFLYAVYDFGMGPVVVEDIKIGDTPITNFADVQYNLVDFNKPLVDEGYWDAACRRDLALYKGDVTTENYGIALDGNKSVTGTPEDLYQAIRNASPNPENLEQSITVTLLNPQGLYAFNSNGNMSSRTIDLEIYFAKVGTEEWFAWNDPTYVNDFLGVGGDEDFTDVPLELYRGPNNPDEATPWTKLYEGKKTILKVNDTIFGYYSGRHRSYGFAKGQKTIPVKDQPNLQVGSAIRYNGKTIGRVISKEPIEADYYLLTIEGDGFPESVYIYNAFGDYYNTGSGTNLFWTINSPEETQAKVFRGQGVVGRARIARQDQSPVYSTFRFTPKSPGEYKVRVTRINTFSAYTTSVQDSLIFSSLMTRTARAPIVTTKRHTFLELRIRATNQLNGNIQNLSALCTSVLDVWNGSSWVKQPTRNPAWVYADLLTGPVNKRAIPKSRLHLDSLVEWAEFCDEIPTAPPELGEYLFPRFEANFILDYSGTLQSVLSQVTGAAQASLNVIDGKYGVLIDRKRTTPVQIFTPRNSRDFQSSRAYTNKPHAVRVRYIDPTIDWEVTELVVYDDGYDVDTATEIEDLTSFGVTNNEQAYRFGRYMLAQNRLRQETMSLTVDFEFLVCSRGDYVQITQDVMRAGGRPARVKTIVGNRITVDDAFDLPAGSYGYVYRAADGTIRNNTLTIVSADTFDLDGSPLPQVGDLIIIGEVGQIVFDCIVKSITPNDDLTANLVLVEKADAIYDAESLGEFPVYDPQISNVTDPNVAPPGEVQSLQIIENSYRCDGLGYLYYIDLDWDVPTGSAFESFQVFVNFGSGFTEAGTTRESNFRYVVDEANLGIVHEFKVLAVSASGLKLDLGTVGTVSATPLPKSTPPSDVQSLSIDITGEVLQLIWPAVTDCDVQEYLIRYSPQTSGVTWEASIPLLRANRNQTLAAAQARTGTYLIKAVDFNGNESVGTAQAITTIPNLFNLNIIEEISDFPALQGTFDRTENDGGALMIQKSVSGDVNTTEFYPNGYYYYSNLLDLGEIYTVRLQSLIQAEGFTLEDMMSNWVTLADVEFLTNSKFSEWDVETQYRSTENLNVMSDWVTLDAVDPIGGGVTENFTEWRRFTIGDATGRIFQFRLNLISRKTSVTPRVFDGTIRADMPDRSEIFNNLLATAANGALVQYDPAFKGPGTSPNVQVTIDGAQAGDYPVFENKTLEGVRIRIYDINDNPVERTIDVSVRGYGRRASSVI